MLQKIRERLLLVTIALLPFHALFVTLTTRVIGGIGNAPIGILTIWKEVLMLVIIGISCIEIFSRHTVHSSVLSFIKKEILQTSLIDKLCISFGILALIIHIFTKSSIAEFAVGGKYVLFPLVLLLVFSRVSWSEDFLKKVQRILIIIGCIISCIGFIFLLLPIQVLEWIGYSAGHSLYFSDGPLAAFQLIGNTTVRRIQSTMSGPNQFGLWILIPLSLSLVEIIKRTYAKNFSYQLFFKNILSSRLLFFAILLMGSALIGSYSRTAWISFAAIGILWFARRVPMKIVLLTIVQSALVLVFVVFIGFQILSNHGCSDEVIDASGCNPRLATIYNVLVRKGSSRGHFKNPIIAVQTMIQHPIGKGLSSAGPANHRFSDTCVHLRPQDDPTWAKPLTSLCVFLGSTQVQPTNRQCSCPVLPENWYLQIGVELGWIGFILFVVLIVIILKTLSVALIGSPSEGLYLAFVGIAVGCVLLHAWEDSAVAYTLWSLVGVMLSKKLYKVNYL